MQIRVRAVPGVCNDLLGIATVHCLDIVHHCNQMREIAPLGNEIPSHDDLTFDIDGSLGVVPLDETVQDTENSAFGVKVPSSSEVDSLDP